jgi:hypothetical protein
MKSTSQKTFKNFNAKLFFIVSSFNMDLDDELVMFNTFFFLKKWLIHLVFTFLNNLLPLVLKRSTNF